ncbi:RNA polymerase factor sigma-54 [Virgibacillus byunsanensis]|uniref:RNA polymerase factor sigma-54 n=1 Tax=Virgibacillus byunsanensis TaxID=570945 RepID=A0ABW3LI82_9BACI
MEMQLQQRQNLNIVMTADLRQAISLLQYSTYELYQYILQQYEGNPLIELVENEETISYKESFPIRTGTSKGPQQYENDPFDYIANEEASMHENLLQQVNWLDISVYDRNIVQYLILNLDENGYLDINEAEIAAELQIDESSVTKGISLLQQLEPIGLGARNLSECFLLQLKHFYPEETTAQLIIRNHLDNIADKKWEIITKEEKVTLAEVKRAYDIIKTLHPKPCTLYSTTATEYLVPDIIIENKAGGYEVYLNDKFLPGINLNTQYFGMTTNKDETYKYVQDKYKEYQWLQNSLEQRRNTILKITHSLMKRQSDFFIQGFSALRPLTLKEVADEINMHESTVSRATMNKVIQTPIGSFNLRKLFTTKLSSTNGNTTSQTKVKILLEELIQKEDKRKPISDQKISEELKLVQNIVISRRTVAKYREELKIPPSRKRREI